MVQIIPARRDYVSESLREFNQSGAAERFSQHFKNKESKKQLAEENKAIKDRFDIDLSSITNPDDRKIIMTEMLKRQGKEDLLNKKSQLFDQFLNPDQQSFGDQIRGEQNVPQGIFKPEFEEQNAPPQEQPQQKKKFDASTIPDELIFKLGLVDKDAAQEVRMAKDSALKQNRFIEESERKEFKEERDYHSSYAKEAEKDANNLRTTIPRKENALHFARDAVETGDMSYFSPDKLADATGIDLFRTAKGAQLVTAGKENLLSNLSRVSARAQNLWMEQRMSSMFPKIGQSQEANLTTQEMLEGEVEMDKTYLKEFDRLADEDQEKYGYVRKDIQKRAVNAAKTEQDEVLKRTSYRIKEVEEQEKGLTSLKKQVGYKVLKGTPLTLTMAKLYKEKFGDKALATAKANGYYIPSLEEFKYYQQRPEEHRDEPE